MCKAFKIGLLHMQTYLYTCMYNIVSHFNVTIGYRIERAIYLLHELMGELIRELIHN